MRSQMRTQEILDLACPTQLPWVCTCVPTHCPILNTLESNFRVETMGSSPAVRIYFALIFSFACLALFAPRSAQLATAPLLLTRTNSTRAIAVESTTLLAEPFAPNSPVPFSAENRTRVILFATN